MGQVKEINIKNQTYYFFNDMINIKNVQSNVLKIEKKLYLDIDIYYKGYTSRLRNLMIVKIFTM